MQSIRKYRSIQTLRALAALGVVAFHTNGNVLVYGWLPELFARVSRYGEIGVDVFFVISGFVMAMVTHGEPVGWASARTFMAARLARVVPLYWLLTALFIALLLVVPGAFGNAHFIAWHAITSFLFFPSLNWAHITAPVLGVGWTLNYEMWFYIVFMLAMCATRYRLLLVSALLLLSCSLRWLLDGSVALDFYTNPIVLEFVFGCCVGWLYASGRTVPVRVAGLLLVAVAVAGKVFAPTLTDTNRFLVFGLPALAVVVAGLALEDRVRWSALLERIGDASYSLYLTHVFSVPIAAKVLQVLDRRHRLPGDLACLLVVLVATAVGLACYRWVERPLIRFCRPSRRTRVRKDLLRAPGVDG
ncbi:acyltransferase [Paraburkholderia sp. PREW-6R]|uniref:acyltransferase family protein n=1 Tax=Paraburkholderia sp. PREW-6R TaxID=3141544 RepID=UPI0031F5BDF4